MTNMALILSGGAGLRAGTKIPKQYIKAKGRPIISYCIETFEALEEIDYIQIVAESEWHSLIEKALHHKPHGFSRPGENRQMSIFNGLTDLLPMAEDHTVVIIHDAARPRVSGKQILDCLRAPECFLLKPYYEANAALLPERILTINGSTEPAILAGLDIVLVKGDENNSKITTEKDLKEFISFV